jgi:hypothetical protein
MNRLFHKVVTRIVPVRWLAVALQLLFVTFAFNIQTTAFADGDARLKGIILDGDARFEVLSPTVTSGTAQSPTLWFAFDPNQYYVGSYVLGTFTATSTTQTINVGISYANSTFALLSTITSQLSAVLGGTPDGFHKKRL